MAANEKMFTVDRFLGINQEADGSTELAMGEASEMLNFAITDGFNLKTRPGVNRVRFGTDRVNAPILASWAGHISAESEHEYLVAVDFFDGHDRIWWYYKGAEAMERHVQTGALGLTSATDHMVKIFAFNGKLWIMSRENTVSFQGEQFQAEPPYIPKVITGATPSGGGTELEAINLLTPKRRIDYSADGTAKAYVLPEEAQSVEKITLDGNDYPLASAGSFDSVSHTFTFGTAPQKGVGNLEFTYQTYTADAQRDRMTILSMPLVEAYNGSTDTRLFFGGNGNVCYYTGVPETGEVTPMYFPALNYVSVDMTGAAVTGLVRHYSRLLVFTRDGAYSLSYEPVTLPGGMVTAGFYLRAVNREFGNEALGQVQTVDNFPRTITQDGVYEWKVTASYYTDERYARLVSGRVQNYMKDADIRSVVTCDDSLEKTYYVFLNDNLGTVLVNRYGLSKGNIWCVYRSRLFSGVKSAFLFGGAVHFANGQEVFALDESISRDVPETEGSDPMDIECLWKSGYMSFGADFKRKFSSEVYVSMLPETHSGIEVTAETDKRSEYAKKQIANNVFSFASLDFADMSFNTASTPKIRRMRIKVKKFVYYRLIFRTYKSGQRATLLSYDQKIRYGSMAK